MFSNYSILNHQDHTCAHFRWQYLRREVFCCNTDYRNTHEINIIVSMMLKFIDKNTDICNLYVSFRRSVANFARAISLSNTANMLLLALYAAKHKLWFHLGIARKNYIWLNFQCIFLTRRDWVPQRSPMVFFSVLFVPFPLLQHFPQADTVALVNVNGPILS